MPAKSPLSDRELRRLEQRLAPSNRRRALVMMKKVLWRLVGRSGRLLKRLIDIVVAGAALVALSPLLLLVAAAIRLGDGGPVLFWQTRIGKWGRPFPFPKFRSMVVDAEALRVKLEQTNMHGGDGVTFKMKKDPRITLVGRFIRRTSIDELPQLWCVLKGDMSLVGPRPALASEVSRYTLEERRRLDATPGLTCTWQVAGRSDIPFPEQLRLDVEYIEGQTAWEDIKLLLKTVPAVISGRGAY
jgi:lipopolysaccharide/colanic/teichoic acid biosynthesis glycosyltransferase